MSDVPDDWLARTSLNWPSLTPSRYTMMREGLMRSLFCGELSIS